MKKSLYVDANVFIVAGVYPQESPEFKAAKKLLYAVSSGEAEAATSLLTWDELVWVVRRMAGNEAAAEEGKRFLEIPNMKFLGVTENIIRKAQNITERYNLKPRDAIHTASAIVNNAGSIVSDDADFDAVRGLKRIALERA
ncbi:MAG: type II toxin-antitoxin system VapC family toxin [Candidatus Aenigmarchaeota archaeon]|nr:type II toxin-antitoxin system VapC family toxin [Candidatus Aenigmarchaeota archaeon]